MTQKEMIERSFQALAEFDRLPHEEQVRRLIAAGIINEKGEVLFGDKADQTEPNLEQTTPETREA